MFRIGFDAKRLFNNFTGLGNYSRTLLKNLAQYYPDNAYFLYTPKVVRNNETQFYLNSPLYSVQQPRHRFRNYWRSAGMKRDLMRHRIDLYHGLSHEVPLGIERTGIPSIVTIHDLIFKRFPDQYKPADRFIYDRKFRYACQHAQHIIAISEATKQDIITYFDTDPEKISVIYQSCDERFLQERSGKTIEQTLARYQIPNEYLFYVGSLIERKNLLGIINAMAQLPKSLRIPLVIVGRGDSYRQLVEERAQQLGIRDLLYFIRPDFADLPPLYQQASAFLYPSLAEGFGIPVLEALCSKTPVITSNVSSLPEAAGPDACLVDPQQVDAIAAGIEQVLTDSDSRQQMIEHGFIHAQQFLGEPLTHQLHDLYQQFLTTSS